MGTLGPCDSGLLEWLMYFRSPTLSGRFPAAPQDLCPHLTQSPPKEDAHMCSALQTPPPYHIGQLRPQSF